MATPQALSREFYEITTKDHPFSKYAKFSGKLKFTLQYGHILVRIRG